MLFLPESKEKRGRLIKIEVSVLIVYILPLQKTSLLAARSRARISLPPSSDQSSRRSESPSGEQPPTRMPGESPTSEQSTTPRPGDPPSSEQSSSAQRIPKRRTAHHPQAGRTSKLRTILHSQARRIPELGMFYTWGRHIGTYRRIFLH